MNIPPQQMHQQHAMVKNQAHTLLAKVKTSAPHSQLAQTMDHHVRTLEGMMAAGKSQASIDAHMKLMNKTIVDAQKQAYAPHSTPLPGQTSQHYGYSSNAGHFQPGGQAMATPQNAGHFSTGPSVHALNDARAMMRNMSKVGRNGNALF